MSLKLLYKNKYNALQTQQSIQGSGNHYDYECYSSLSNPMQKVQMQTTLSKSAESVTGTALDPVAGGISHIVHKRLHLLTSVSSTNALE